MGGHSGQVDLTRNAIKDLGRDILLVHCNRVVLRDGRVPDVARTKCVLSKLRIPLRRVYDFLDLCGILEHTRPSFGGMGLIVCLHKVEPPKKPLLNPSLAIYADSLDKILGHLRARGWDILSTKQVHDRLTQARSSHPFVCFTFDDGYTDNFTRALPVFRHHSAPLCINVTVGYISRTTPGWWDVLEGMLMQHDAIEYCVSGDVERITLATWEDKVRAYQRLSSHIFEDVLAGRPPLGTTWTRNGVNPSSSNDCVFLNWQQLQELARDPLVEIGAHSMTHPSLVNLNENEAGDEMLQSKRMLEEHLGVAVQSMAYPFGLAGTREVRLAREVGFNIAFTVQHGNVYSTHKADLLSLPRKCIAANDASVSRLRSLLYAPKFW